MRLSELRSGTGPGSSIHRYFFTTPALRLRLDLVRDYIQNAESPVLVCGDAGAGKSAFLDQIVSRADSCWRLVRVPAVATFSAIEVVQFLSTELRLPVNESIEAMIGELDRFLGKSVMRGRLAVIVVDDAQDLSDVALRRLVTLGEELESTNHRLLMTGSPPFRPRLTALLAGIRSREHAHVITIPRLDEREVACYIDMKLHHAGVNSRQPLSRAVVGEIARSSRGHPGRIDELTDALLSRDPGRPDGRRAPSRLRRLIGQLSGLGALR